MGGIFLIIMGITVTAFVWLKRPLRSERTMNIVYTAVAIGFIISGIYLLVK